VRTPPATVWSNPPLPASDAGVATDNTGMCGSPEVLAALDALGRMLYPLFSVSVYEHAWVAAGYDLLDMET
jgi:hypothetical protein